MILFVVSLLTKSNDNVYTRNMRRKENNLQMRLSDEQKGIMRSLAAKLGLTMSGFVWFLVLKYKEGKDELR